MTNLTDLDRNMMLSIDILNVPTDEAVREVENRLLGVETNITNWQRDVYKRQAKGYEFLCEQALRRGTRE